MCRFYLVNLKYDVSSTSGHVISLVLTENQTKTLLSRWSEIRIRHGQNTIREVVETEISGHSYREMLPILNENPYVIELTTALTKVLRNSKTYCTYMTNGKLCGNPISEDYPCSIHKRHNVSLIEFKDSLEESWNQVDNVRPGSQLDIIRKWRSFETVTQ